MTTCSVRESILPKSGEVCVNGVAIARGAIAREIQHHPAATPAAAWKEAVRALTVRELLLQEVQKLGIVAKAKSDAQERRETEEEALIRELFEREVKTPEPDRESCQRYYQNNRRRFRSKDIFEAAHILFAASIADAQGYERARAEAESTLELLRRHPERFAEFAQARSACASAAQGGNLGQITAGQVTPEFERALRELSPGRMSQAPVATRYGFHLIRLDRKQDGRELPFELVAERIADYLRESVRRRAIAQYIARLVSAAKIEGFDLASADMLRVN
jgi:peptidyl-prolyl cis-trans isomerase C